MSSYRPLLADGQFTEHGKEPTTMTHPDDIPVATDEDDAGPDEIEVDAEADEADLIEQATPVPHRDDEDFDR
jgi:hypothetical protein